MKKIIFLMSLAIFALVSCNKDSVVETNNGSRISFRTAVDTRATEMMQNELQKFYVTALYEDGTEYFSALFTREGNVFVSENDYYWPSDETLSFYAYHPCDEIINITGESALIEDFTPAAEIADQIDFISAVKVTNKEESAAGVALEFEHKLSQIEVKAKNDNKGYTVKVKAVRIKNVAKSGDFDFVGAMTNWKVNETLTNYEIAYTDPVLVSETPATLMGQSGNAMLIPQSRIAWGPEQQSSAEEPSELNEEGTPVEGELPEQGETPEDSDPEEETVPTTAADGMYIALQIQVDAASGSRIFPVTGDDDYGWVAVPVAINWNAGYKYTYVCDFSKGLGVIAPDQVDPDNPDEDNPYNPGDSVVGGKIGVSVSYDGWSSHWIPTQKM